MQRPDAGVASCRTEPGASREIGAGPGGARRLILGAILAGGQASRFGSDKAAALFAGRRLIDHVRTALVAHVSTIVVVGRAEGIADFPRPGLGPLGGIAGAMRHASRHGFTDVLTMPCDTPFPPPSLLEALLRRSPSYCVDVPVIGLWPAAVADDLCGRLTRGDGDRSVRRWARDIGALPIAAPAPIANINAPEDLLAL
ncbi:molybdenum cofactor guanylyltransferase [uncultured Sphingomonas sp.]|uniref:molybdenum cofactor guanylyltransferase n=1 Tax=uncultured Sphingomonas sp. TaxID=158754 RepID=UPI00259A004A|nr:molybdenum cofactor guanylyltransferase [uncultured Sphingomonas sp.]